MRHLRSCLGKPLLPELSDFLLRYFRSTKRRSHESMGDYITKKCEVYMRSCQALQRVMPHQKAGRGSDSHQSSGYEPWWSNFGSRWNSVESQASQNPEAAETDEELVGDEPIAAAPTTATPGTERTEWWHDSNAWGRDGHGGIGIGGMAMGDGTGRTHSPLRAGRV